MSYIFHPRANAYFRLALLGVAAFVVIGATVLVRLNWSNWSSREEVFVNQPVPFSHQHHVSGLGIDCRYCHTSVEQSSSAGIPPTHTCMSCHSQLWTESEMLEPVRASYRTGQPIEWNRVHNLPDYVYFNHSIHVNKGVGCETCHGRVDQMPLVYQENDLYMQWCLDCHRQPEQYIRPVEYIYAFGYELPEGEQLDLGRQLVREYGIQVDRLSNCSICHR